MCTGFAQSSRLGLGRWRSLFRGWFCCLQGGDRWGDNTCTVSRGFVLSGWKKYPTTWAYFLLSFFFLLIKCIIKDNKKFYVAIIIHIHISKNSVPFSAAWLETDELMCRFLFERKSGATSGKQCSGLSCLAQEWPWCVDTKPRVESSLVEPGCRLSLGLRWEIWVLVLPPPLKKCDSRQAAQSLFLIFQMGVTSALEDISKIARGPTL